uniref:Uncharacterized protein n=1 Tax=Nelumbo nucifera TaxID=4432 RepID=A0A822Z5U6_NELNU|nr:TPA_asm: hypothetical protein HUJ06_014266 [Nelumbo nucifera]
MSFAAQSQLTNSRSHICLFCSMNLVHGGDPLKHLATSTLPFSSRHGGSSSSLHFGILRRRPPWLRNQQQNFEAGGQWRVRVFESSHDALQREGLDSKLNLEAFLSIVEVLCIVPSAVLSVGYAVNWAFFSSPLQKSLQVSLVNRIFVWQFVLLVGAVAAGALVRRRQWRRICRDTIKTGAGGSSVNLIERIEKIEEDLRSSATIIRVLSRQLEKLGTRFRVTRKALKEPITQTAALAQKNSEATRSLAVQEDNLEKELVEIQKVLLAMQMGSPTGCGKSIQPLFPVSTEEKGKMYMEGSEISYSMDYLGGKKPKNLFRKKQNSEGSY